MKEIYNNGGTIMLVARCEYETGCTEPKIIQFLVGRKDERCART